jgi:hypothetical protein
MVSLTEIRLPLHGSQEGRRELSGVLDVDFPL